MIAGEKKVKKEELVFETILSKVSEYDIFRWYMPNKNWQVNKATYSPFRKESNPSFVIYSKDNRLFYMDHSDPHYRGGCFDLVKQLFNVGHNECLEMIDRDFNLGIRKEKKRSSKLYRDYI